MKAVLLAAGFGTRLRPLTLTVPKCLVPIAGKPLMQYWLEQLTRAGLNDFLVNTHYLPDAVRGFVAGSPWRDRITLVHEDQLLGTGGTLLANRPFLDGDDVLLAHADNLCLCDFPAFFAAHAARPGDCLMTMMLFRTPTPQSCGIVEQDGQGRVVAFHEKVPNPPSDLANAAVYLLSPEFGPWLDATFPGRTELDFSTEVIPLLMGRIATWTTEGYMRDIGTPESLTQAEKDLAP